MLNFHIEAEEFQVCMAQSEIFKLESFKYVRHKMKCLKKQNQCVFLSLLRHRHGLIEF